MANSNKIGNAAQFSSCSESQNSSKIKAEFVRYSKLTSNDCSLITKIPIDRVVNNAHKSELRKQIASSLPLIPPITVNIVTGHIIDGKHRWEAFQECVKKGIIDANSTIDVKYVKIDNEDDERRAIIDANTHSKNWGIDDYLHSYTESGNIYYKKLEEWCKGHVLATGVKGRPNLRYGAAMIKGKGCCSELKMGKFTFTEEELARADEIHGELLEITGIFPDLKSGAWIESAAIAWHSVRDLHPFKVWLKELKAKKTKLSDMAKQSKNDWMNIFSTIHIAIDTKAA